MLYKLKWMSVCLILTDGYRFTIVVIVVGRLSSSTSDEVIEVREREVRCAVCHIVCLLYIDRKVRDRKKNKRHNIRRTHTSKYQVNTVICERTINTQPEPVDKTHRIEIYNSKKRYQTITDSNKSMGILYVFLLSLTECATHISFDEIRLNTLKITVWAAFWRHVLKHIVSFLPTTKNLVTCCDFVSFKTIKKTK